MCKTYFYYGVDTNRNVYDGKQGKYLNPGKYLDIWNCLSWEEKEIYDNNFKVFVSCQEDNY